MLAAVCFSSGLGYHLDSIIYRFYICFTSLGPSHAVQPIGDSRASVNSFSAFISTNLLVLEYPALAVFSFYLVLSFCLLPFILFHIIFFLGFMILSSGGL